MKKITMRIATVVILGVVVLFLLPKLLDNSPKNFAECTAWRQEKGYSIADKGPSCGYETLRFYNPNYIFPKTLVECIEQYSASGEGEITYIEEHGIKDCGVRITDASVMKQSVEQKAIVSNLIDSCVKAGGKYDTAQSQTSKEQIRSCLLRFSNR